MKFRIDKQFLKILTYPKAEHKSEYKVKILIAEDNLVNQELIRFLIKSRGWDCEVVDDGEKAIREFSNAYYDIILMDIQMPIMNGIDATRAIRSSNKNIPIIAITAAKEQDLRAESIDAGMNDFISKPYRKEDLFSSIDRCLCMSA